MGVLIGGMPAARMGDMATCVGPPDSIMMGCMTVLIGETMAGGGGGGGAGGAAPGMGSAAQAALASAAFAGTDPQQSEVKPHYLDVTFKDKAGLAIGGVQYAVKAPDGTASGGVLGGGIKRTGVAEGSHEITLRAIANAQWDKQKAKVGDTVRLKIETAGVDSGAKAVFDVFVKDGNYADHVLTALDATVRNGKAEVEWTLDVDEKYLAICGEKSKRGRYSQPFFYFIVHVGDLTQKSGILLYQDYVEIELRDEANKPVTREEYRLYLPTGETREGQLDGTGRAKEERIPPGNISVAFPDRDDV